MNIFLCYPSAERATADQINLALVAQGHDVFFDRDDFSEGDEYHHRISRVIKPSDVFIFLVTPGSLAKRRDTLMELDIAQAKWEHPSRHVLPVMGPAHADQGGASVPLKPNRRSRSSGLRSRLAARI